MPQCNTSPYTAEKSMLLRGDKV